MDGWLRQAINRHAAAAAHADWSAQITESAHVSRQPDEPVQPGYGLGGTGGGGARRWAATAPAGGQGPTVDG